MTPVDIPISTYAAWDTYRAGFLSLDEFLAEFVKHDAAVEALAAAANLAAEETK